MGCLGGGGSYGTPCIIGCCKESSLKPKIDETSYAKEVEVIPEHSTRNHVLCIA